MAKKVNCSESNGNDNLDLAYDHYRVDPLTGEKDWYFPMRITDPSDRVYAHELGLVICYARLGGRKFWAVMVPCKDSVTVHGLTVFVDTPSEVQHKRYLEYRKAEDQDQDRERAEGRCQIPDGCGGVKRCPRRVPNPDYVPGGKEKKTLPNLCEGCPYEDFKNSHTCIPLSTLDCEGDDGTRASFDPSGGDRIMEADLYEHWSREFIALVHERCPKLSSQAELILQELNNSEVAREIGRATSTTGSRADKLKELAREFMNTLARP